MNIVAASDRARLAGLFRRGWDAPAGVRERVSGIIDDVRRRGDAALIEYTRAFDSPSYDIGMLRVRIPSSAQARSLVPLEIANGLRLARERVASFHARQLREDIAYVDDDGTQYGFAFRPLDSVAAYVPGGTATLPSSVIMTCVPAKIAGVARVAVLTPPQRDGRVSAAVQYACSLCGVDELYADGGAQAIAAGAYGTSTIAAVDKIVGPGNIWVTEAKRQVYGVCAIDGLAGPSEVLVVADELASTEYVVSELLAQAEHDPLARVAVVSESATFLRACGERLDGIAVAKLPRGDVIGNVLEKGCYFVHAANRQEVFEVIDAFAPEHLSLQVSDATGYLPRIRYAGAVFVGPQTPVACGDYVAGTNHVLPTSGAARFSSGLNTGDFVRSFTVVRNSAARMRGDATVLAALAEFEGLPQHAQSARIRAAITDGELQ